jgi:hypothetical protein
MTIEASTKLAAESSRVSALSICSMKTRFSGSPARVRREPLHVDDRAMLAADPIDVLARRVCRALSGPDPLRGG